MKKDSSKWKLPPNYKGKYELAKAKNKKRVNQLDSGTDADGETDDDDWSDSDADIMGPNMGQGLQSTEDDSSILQRYFRM